MNSKIYKEKKKISSQDLILLYEAVGINFIKDSNPYIVSIENLEIIEYFPGKFSKMKRSYANADILESLISPYNFQKLISLIKEEGGRSEAFIFLTHDQRFLIKTISNADRKYFLSTILVKYIERMEMFPESKLVRILGIFKVNPMKQNLIIMENLLVNKQDCVIFDLKGSKVARFVKGIENPKKPPLGSILKDTNFLLYDRRIKLSEESKQSILSTLRMDFNLLRECGVIDYSIILGIYEKNHQIQTRSMLVANDGTKFSLGIIDIFQEYNFSKASEKTIKIVFNKKKDISVASPSDYFNRICEFSSKIFE